MTYIAFYSCILNIYCTSATKVLTDLCSEESVSVKQKEKATEHAEKIISMEDTGDQKVGYLIQKGLRKGERNGTCIEILKHIMFQAYCISTM